MTEKSTIDIDALDAGVAQIFQTAIAESLNRLTSITGEDRADNMAFDRVARTALAFLRIAQAADALVARNRKEQSDNDRTGADADRDARFERDAAALQKRLDDYIDKLAGGGAAAAGPRDGARDGASGRGRA